MPATTTTIAAGRWAKMKLRRGKVKKAPGKKHEMLSEDNYKIVDITIIKSIVFVLYISIHLRE